MNTEFEENTVGKPTKVLTIKTKHQPRGRDYLGAGGRPFNTQPQHLPLADLKKHEIDELKADPWLIVEEGEVDLAPAPKKPDESPDAALLALLEGNVTVVVTAIPDLTDAQLERLHKLESDGAARKGVLDAIDSEIEKRTAPK